MPVNTANARAVADAIESHSIPDLGFSMQTLFCDTLEDQSIVDLSGHDCSTAACVAGWTVASLEGGVSSISGSNASSIARQAAHLLGLSWLETQDLFYPISPDRPAGSCDFLDASPAMAVRTLRHLADTADAGAPVVCWHFDDAEAA